MTWILLNWRSVLITLLVGLLISVISLMNYYRHSASDWQLQAEKQSALALSKQEIIKGLQLRQQKLVMIDKTHTEALSEAESKNDDLRRQLASGARRMYLSAKCPVGGESTNTAARSMGDGTPFEITGNTRRNILNLRAGIIRDQAKLKYLQDYILEQCQ